MEPTWSDVQGILVIGAGAAGLRAAIAAREAGREALVVTSRERGDAHTVLAAGGINAVLGTRDPDDSWQQHAVDTYHEGWGLGDPQAVQTLAQEAPAAVRELESWGCEFARTPEGRIDQRYFGAHSYRRTCYVGDRTGKAVLDALVQRALAVGVEIRPRLHVLRLVVADGRCHGAVALGLDDGRRHTFLADACVLATGGHSGLWKRNSSRGTENKGEGMVLGLRAGCRLADLELVQFHPSGMATPPEWEGTLVSEAVRGEGATLLNARGERFMSNYDAERMELSTRDRVALASYSEIREGRGTEHEGVWLDATHLGRDTIEERLPGTAEQFREALGVDIAEEAMEVSPTAHYSMGGILVDPDTQATDIEALYAVGEVTAGLHGANRLGGNSLAETVVFGRRAGEAAAQKPSTPRAAETIRGATQEAAQDLERLSDVDAASLDDTNRALSELLWQHCGVVRSNEGLKQGLDQLASLGGLRHGMGRTNGQGRNAIANALRLRAGLELSEATLRSAAERRETRGAHVREDYPDQEPAPQRTIVERLDTGELHVTRLSVPRLPPPLAAMEAAQERAAQLLE